MVHATHFHTVATLKTGFLVRRSTFDPGSFAMGFVVEKVALLGGFLGVLYVLRTVSFHSVFLRITRLVHATHFHTVSTLKTGFLVRRSRFDPGSGLQGFSRLRLLAVLDNRHMEVSALCTNRL
jgi:hypothetical protein